ncbi:MAG: lmo0937 family membrane protein [Verrucomicrobia bacterium]|nr:lmo0937 family membrane protein [Prolixibacteraceae bacterium]
MKIGNQDKGIHPVESPVKKRPVEVLKPAQASTNGKSFQTQAPTSNIVVDNSPRFKSEKENFNSSNTAKYLYVIAAVLFLAWIIGFFFYKLDANIHMLLALAVIVAVISFMQGKRNKTA